MSIKKTMRVGTFNFPRVQGNTDEEKFIWAIDEAAKRGHTCLQPGNYVPEEHDALKRIGEHAKEKNVSLELNLHTRKIWDCAGPDAKEAVAEVKQRIELGKALGIKIQRCCYGGLKIPTSRFNREITVCAQQNRIIKSLKVAAKIFEDSDMLLAQENHIDFSGKELAEILSAVNSPNIGCALDTGNSWLVFCDPHEDARALAPFTMTTHMKDMKIVDAHPKKCTPFTLVGTGVGDGDIDMPWVVSEIAQHSPYAEGMHLLVEFGWIQWDPEREKDDQRDEIIDRSVKYLKGITELEY